MPPFDAPAGRWLSIVGIGEDGIDGLSGAAKRLIADAAIVFGGARHLALAAPLISGAQRSWPQPFAQAVEAVQACRPQPTCVLASGDPFQHGVGATIARHVPASEMSVVPAPSAFSLAAARLGWSLPDVTTLALHARSFAAARPHLHAGVRLLALMADGAAPAAFCASLTAMGFGPSAIWVLEALGGPRERIRHTTARGFDVADIQTPVLVAVAAQAEPGTAMLGLAAGRPEHLFEHDGQISRPEARALALAALAPRPGDLLWDVGAGAGSVAIEWLLASPTLRAVAIERDAERVSRIGRNAQALGAIDLDVVHGTAPEALASLLQPNAVFVGGGATAAVLDHARAALAVGGRLVVHAVTLETEALLMARHAEDGGALTRIDLFRAAALGTRTGWRPAMPLVQWSWTKP